jgi:hypothetical protein
MRSSERPSKREVFLELLRDSWSSLHLDARRPGVVVPEHLRGEPHLVLQYGLDLPIPILDLEVDDDGVRATLSFSKHPERTVVPWSAVYVVTCNDGRGVLYHEDVPEDVSIIATHPLSDRLVDDTPDAGVGDDESDAEIENTANGSPMGSAIPGITGPSGRISERLLRSVPSDDAVAGLSPPASGRRRRKPQLRLVK